MPRPRTKTVLKIAFAGGVPAVKAYLSQPDMVIDPYTWCGNIKKLLDEGKELSVGLEIELIKQEFNFFNDGKEDTNTE